LIGSGLVFLALESYQERKKQHQQDLRSLFRYDLEKTVHGGGMAAGILYFPARQDKGNQAGKQ
jgi:hypothetical protein